MRIARRARNRCRIPDQSTNRLPTVDVSPFGRSRHPPGPPCPASLRQPAPNKQRHNRHIREIKPEHENQHPDRRKSTTQKPETTKTEPRTHTASHKVRRHQKTQEKAHSDAISEGDGLLAPTASRRAAYRRNGNVFDGVCRPDVRYRGSALSTGRETRAGGGAMNDGNMIQEPPACPVCGLAVEERDPRRGKPLSIHRACPEPAPGGAEEGTGTRTPHVAGVAPDGIQERRRRGRPPNCAGGWACATRPVGPAEPRDGRTVLLVGQMQAALMRLEPETLMAYEERWAVDLAGPSAARAWTGSRATGWRGPRHGPWTRP